MEDEWISALDRMPDYYDLVWATDGVQVVLARKIGRSLTPPEEIWRNAERNGCEELYGVIAWQPCVKPKV